MSTDDAVKMVETLEVRNDDVVLVRVKVGTSAEDAKALLGVIKETICAKAPEAKILAVTDDIDITVLDEQQMATMGWFRRHQLLAPSATQ